MLTEAQFAIVAQEAKQRIGLALTRERLASVDARLTPLARRENCACAGELISMIQRQGDDMLWHGVVDALVMSDTHFFRDRAQFRALGETIIPDLLRGRPAHARLRVWSAGCAAGQEPYSLAILLEEMREEGRGGLVDILATDISSRVLDKAASGLFSQFEVQRGLSLRRLIAHFERVGEMWRIADRLRAAVRFETHNLLVDAAQLGPFDLVLCRNVLSSFDETDRRETLERIAAAMSEDGVLVLGAEEDYASLTGAFEPAHGACVMRRNAYWRRAA